MILIITRDQALREMWTRAVGDRRMTLVAASSCRDALSLSGLFNLDAIVFDVRTLDDWQCCRLLHRRARSVNTPIIGYLSKEATSVVQEPTAEKVFAATVAASCAAGVLMDLLDRVVDRTRGPEIA